MWIGNSLKVGNKRTERSKVLRQNLLLCLKNIQEVTVLVRRREASGPPEVTQPAPVRPFLPAPFPQTPPPCCPQGALGLWGPQS